MVVAKLVMVASCWLMILYATRIGIHLMKVARHNGQNGERRTTKKRTIVRIKIVQKIIPFMPDVWSLSRDLNRQQFFSLFLCCIPVHFSHNTIWMFSILPQIRRVLLAFLKKLSSKFAHSNNERQDSNVSEYILFFWKIQVFFRFFGVFFQISQFCFNSTYQHPTNFVFALYNE